MKTNLLFKSRAVKALFILLTFSFFIACSNDDDDPVIDPKPPVTKDLTYQSTAVSDAKVTDVSALEFKKTENWIVKTAHLTDDGKTKEINFARPGMKAAVKIVLPTEIPVIKEGADLGTLTIKQLTKTVGTMVDSVYSVSFPYELEGFANGMKISVETSGDSTIVSKDGKSPVVPKNARYKFTEVKYDASKCELVEGTERTIDGLVVVDMKFKLEFVFKDDQAEKVTPVDVTIAVNKETFNPEIGENGANRTVKISQVQDGNFTKATLEVTIPRKFGDEFVKIEEELASYSEAPTARELKALVTDIQVKNPTPKIETDEKDVDGKKAITTSYTYDLTWDQNVTMKHLRETKEVDVYGIKYTLEGKKETVALLAVTVFPTSSYPKDGYVSHEMVSNFEITLEKESAYSLLVKDYLFTPKNSTGNPYNVNLAYTKDVVGWNPSFTTDGVRKHYCIIAYGTKETGDGGLAIYTKEGQLKNIAPWAALKNTGGKPLAVIEGVGGDVYLCSIEPTGGNDWGWVIANIGAPDTPIYTASRDDVDLSAVTEVKENADYSVTVKNTSNGQTLTVKGLQ